MLNLIFLILMVIVLYKAMHGDLADTLCNFAIAVGVIGALIGIVSVILSKSATSAALFLNIFVLIFAACLKLIARQFVKLHNDKEERAAEQLRAEFQRYVRTEADAVPTVYNDDNFDDPEIRFGKGGYTDPKL